KKLKSIHSNILTIFERSSPFLARVWRLTRRDRTKNRVEKYDSALLQRVGSRQPKTGDVLAEFMKPFLAWSRVGIAMKSPYYHLRAIHPRFAGLPLRAFRECQNARPRIGRSLHLDACERVPR